MSGSQSKVKRREIKTKESQEIIFFQILIKIKIVTNKLRLIYNSFDQREF